MEIEIKNPTYFTTLMEKSDKGESLLKENGINSYKASVKKKLDKKYKETTKRQEFMDTITYWAFIFASSDMFLDLFDKTNELIDEVNEAKSNIYAFESELACLILNNFITNPSTLGYKTEYIDKLLDKKRQELKDSAITYYVDEKTGKTTDISNGKCEDLSYIPYQVKEELNRIEPKKLLKH